MFCSTLRKKSPWATIVPDFFKPSAPGWKECQLFTHDVAFPVSQNGNQGATFRLILLSTPDVGTPETAQSIERLSLLNGGKHSAIVMLLSGNDHMAAFARLQLGMLSGVSLPIIPITSAMDVIPTLDKLRRAYNKPNEINCQPSLQTMNRQLVSHCVRGPPLSETQVNYLTDTCVNLGDLAVGAFEPKNQQVIRDFLGDRDGGRVVTFFTEGPTSTE